ncbi:MAG: hypothetical protein JWP58_2956, partial [Hymenobacter sp.]|nr:hypothetical protein [Hymenobacter sp.]
PKNTNRVPKTKFISSGDVEANMAMPPVRPRPAAIQPYTCAKKRD